MFEHNTLFGQECWRASELGEALLISPQRVNQLMKEGVLPPPRDGRYHVRAAVPAYILFLQSRIKNKSTAEAAVRKIELNNELSSLRLRQLAESLVPVDRVKADWFRVARHIRDNLLNLPNRLAGPFAAESNQEKIFAVLTQEINQALLDLSSYRGYCEPNNPMEVMGPDQGSGTDEGSKGALLSGGHEDDSLELQHESGPAGGGEDGLESDSNETSQGN